MAVFCFAVFSCKMDAQTNAANSPSEIKKTTKMKEFSLLVRVPVTYTTEQAKASNPQWEKALEQWKADSVYVTSFAFPGESYVVAGAAKSIKKEAVISDNLRVVSNIVLRAISIENAVELAKACPILPYGGTVEVREIVTRPVKPTN